MNTSHFPLIRAESLKQRLSTGEPMAVIDTSFDLADVQAGRRQWHEARLPGSHHLHLDDDLSGLKTGRNGRHPLPDRAQFAAVLARLGITQGMLVVALDRQGGVYAARLWWMLRWMGHAQATVLDGGLSAWSAAGGTLDSGPASVTAVQSGSSTAYTPKPSLAPQTTADELARGLAAAQATCLIDARAPERFRGEVEPLDAQAGHIPGAVNRFFKDNLDRQGSFKPADQLRQDFLALMGPRAPSNVVHSCGSGVTACHNLLAMEVAGLAGSVLYPGSWSEWSSDPARPVARG